jgi:protein-S-isoprenylcysteine O-methyltransferase Ste14
VTVSASPLAVLVLIVGYSCFIVFLWATRRHFLVPGPMPRGMRLVILLSFVGTIWFTVRVVVSGVGPGAPYAIVLMAAAFALFCWTVKVTRTRRLPIAFAGNLPDFIYRTGPYRFVRHPFYLSYILCWIGTSVATRDLWSWTVPLAMTVLYIAVAWREEQRFQRSRLSKAYDAYRKRTAMFVPTLPRSGPCGEEDGP